MTNVQELWTRPQPKPEKRDSERIKTIFCRGVIMPSHNDNEDITMDIIEIKNISLGGIGFVQNAKSKQRYEEQKVYKINIKPDVPWDEPELTVKIAIIHATEGAGYCTYGAIYRNLTDAQMTHLKRIITYQRGINAAMDSA